MEFRLHCDCGQPVMVSEAAADGTATCGACGRSLSVPSLKELRVAAGLPPYHISPELLIENLLGSGEIPWGRSCVHCDAATDDIAVVVTECERSWTKGGLSWPTLALGMLFLPIWFLLVYFWNRPQERELGKNKIYNLPLPICAECRTALHGQKAIKACMQVIPVYQQLLEKFPDASVTVSEYMARPGTIFTSQEQHSPDSAKDERFTDER